MIFMLIDSNILIYSLNKSSPKHRLAQKFIQDHQSELVIADQNIFETIRIITHAKFPNPFSSKQGVAAVSAIADAITVIHPTLETKPITLELIETYKITGAEVFDAYLVATALSNQITTIYTDNIKHLSKYIELTVINPFA